MALCRWFRDVSDDAVHCAWGWGSQVKDMDAIVWREGEFEKRVGDELNFSEGTAQDELRAMNASLNASEGATQAELSTASPDALALRRIDQTRLEKQDEARQPFACCAK